MNKKGTLLTNILLLIAIVIFTSATILSLVKSGIITVREDISSEPILNAEFLPSAERSGSLVITDFQFCDYVNEYLDCQNEQNEFTPDQDFYVRFVVDSSTYNNQITLLRNYQIIDPAGDVVLALDQRNTYIFELASNDEKEPVVFADLFTLGEDSIFGEYTLEVVVENPIFDKTVTLTKKFNLIR